METGNIDHEQIKIDDAETACIKKGKVAGKTSCKWTLDIDIDGEVYKGLELCYHCQSEKEFTPEKAFDLFDYGTSVFVLCNTKKDGSIERKVIGLVPIGNDPYPKLCGLKRFFAKVQQIGSDGYPLWDTLDPMNPVPVCKYYWIFFYDDGSVVTEEVKDTSFQDANATEVLDSVTTIPDGSDSIFTKAFMLHIGKCDQRYVAEQHLLIKDRQIKFDAGAGCPITNCTYVQYSPPNRFYCNVGTGDMVWSHIIQESCPIFLGVTLHVNLIDGSIGDSHTFDLNGYTDYFNPPSSETDNHNTWKVVDIGGEGFDISFDLIPEITDIQGTLISGYLFYIGRPMEFTFDIVTMESHWVGGKNSQDAAHVLWMEKGFEAVTTWKFEQEINPIETGAHSHKEADRYDDASLRDYMYHFCQNRPDCSAKCHHCTDCGYNYDDSWTQGDNGESHVSFNVLGTSGKIDNYWNSMGGEKVGHTSWFLKCVEHYCRFDGELSGFYGGRNGNRDYSTRRSNSYIVAWVSPNVTYIKNQIARSYDKRELHFNCSMQNTSYEDDTNSAHCGGPEVDDFNRWTMLSNECLSCVAGTPDFNMPFLDLEGWPPWPDGYTQNIWYQGAPDYIWWLDRTIYINDVQEPFIRKFDMGDGITFDCSIYEVPYYLDDRSTNPSAGLIVAAKGYQDYSNAAGSSNWKIYHNSIDVTDKVLDALQCDPAVLVTLGMV